jgi:hypothetical protein
MVIPDYVCPVKIGVAVNPRRRILAYACGPFPVVRLAAWPGTHADEKAIHTRFKHHRLTGEWFEPSEEILSFIESVGGCRGKQSRRKWKLPNHEEKTSRVKRVLAHRAIIDSVAEQARELLDKAGKETLSIMEAAQLLNSGSKYLREFCKEKDIEFVLEGDELGFLPGHLTAFLERQPQFVQRMAEYQADAA